MTQELDFPHDMVAEKALLGGLLIAPERLEEVRALVSAADFYRDGHRDVFAAISSLSARGAPVDFISVRAELARLGKLESDDPVYITELTDGAVRSTNVTYYAELVRELAAAREAVCLCLHTVATLRKNPAAISNGVPSRHRTAWDAVVARAVPVRDEGLPDDGLADAVDVAGEGRELAATGVPWRLATLIPALGMLGFLIAYAKVGKTTLGHAFAAAVAMGREFIGLATTACRVLVIAAEDPPEYTAFVARHLSVDRGRMTFWRRSIVLDAAGLARIVGTVRRGGYGLVLISSWQAVIRGLVHDENDNAAAAAVVENVKAAARATGIPWLIDAHSGKGEDQDDGADPSKAMRGASAAAGAADYILSLRYANGSFGTQRRLSGKGRFVSFEPMALDFDPTTSTYDLLGSTKTAGRETTWRLLSETGAISTEPRTAREIALAAGMSTDGKVSTSQWREVTKALADRPDVGRTEELRRGQKTTLYRLLGEAR